MIMQETYRMANGTEIPKLGLGTWFITNAAIGRDSGCSISCDLDGGYYVRYI